VVDKPPGWTSHDVVEAVRGWLGTRRIGHLGTLDPLATGVLPLAVRDATKLIPFLPAGPKSYRGIVRLGAETGETWQLPPMFSSVKRAGVPLYRLARRGEVVEREPRKIQVDRLELLSFEPPDAEIDVICSPGTFVRVLAADLGTALGCGAHVVTLHRTQSGPFEQSEALGVEALEELVRAGRAEERLIQPAVALGLPTVRLSADAVRRIRHGAEIDPPPGTRLQPGQRATGLSPEAAVIAILEARADRRLRPLRVLAPVGARA
jgi:tRNA pseudouridine55 synthase